MLVMGKNREVRLKKVTFREYPCTMSIAIAKMFLIELKSPEFKEVDYRELENEQTLFF